jgi:hypothetical protein
MGSEEQRFSRETASDANERLRKANEIPHFCESLFQCVERSTNSKFRSILTLTSRQIKQSRNNSHLSVQLWSRLSKTEGLPRQCWNDVPRTL